MRSVVSGVLAILCFVGQAGCGSPAAVPGKVTITSTEAFSGMKAHTAKEPGRKPPP